MALFDLLQPLLGDRDDQTLIAAIASFEKRHTARVRVFLKGEPISDARRSASKSFVKAGLDPSGRSLLVFVAPKSRRFAVIAGADLLRQFDAEALPRWRDALGSQLKNAPSIPAAVAAWLTTR